MTTKIAWIKVVIAKNIIGLFKCLNPMLRVQNIIKNETNNSVKAKASLQILKSFLYSCNLDKLSKTYDKKSIKIV